jgi:hypothetical protein
MTFWSGPVASESSNHVGPITRRTGSDKMLLGYSRTFARIRPFPSPRASRNVDLADRITHGVIVSRSEGVTGSTTETTDLDVSCKAVFPGNNDAMCPS